MAEEKQTGARITVHGTAISYNNDAVLLRGPPGLGKSDLALRCIAATGQAPAARITSAAQLVADDRCNIEATSTGELTVSAPENLAGLLEVRGVGIVSVAYRRQARLRLILDLVRTVGEVERLPPENLETENVSGINVARWRIYPLEHSAPLKVALLLDCAILAHR